MQRNWIGRSEGARPEVRRHQGATDSTSKSSRRGSTPSTARRSCCSRPSTRWSIASPPRVPDPKAFRDRVGQFRALSREARLTGEIEKEGLRHRPHGEKSVHGRRRAHLGRQLRPRRIRHRRHHGRARPRRTRLCVCPQVRASDPHRRRSAETPATADDLTERDDELRDAGGLGRVLGR